MYLNKCTKPSKCNLLWFDEKLLTCALENSNLLMYKLQVNQWTNTSSVVNVKFPSQLLNLFITGSCFIFFEYHIRWKCGLIKLCEYLNCSSIQAFCNNRSSISSLIHRNTMIFHLINYDWHEPMCIYEEVHVESISWSTHKPFSKSLIIIPIDTVINIR